MAVILHDSTTDLASADGSSPPNAFDALRVHRFHLTSDTETVHGNIVRPGKPPLTPLIGRSTWLSCRFLRVAPPARFAIVQHRVRHAFPLRGAMRRSLRRMERASAEEITRYQERRLRALVRVAAARSSFYREWFAGSGVDPASIRTLADLPRLPLLDRSHLVHEPDRFLVYPRKLMWVAHSSGTSGRVVTVHRTPGFVRVRAVGAATAVELVRRAASAAESAAAEQRPGSAPDRGADPQGSRGAAAGGLQLPAEPGAAAPAAGADPSVRPAGGRGMALEHHDPGFAAARSWGAVTGDSR